MTLFLEKRNNFVENVIEILYSEVLNIFPDKL